MDKPILSQINIVSGDVDASLAFYNRLGMHIPDAAVWRTASGGQHAGIDQPDGKPTKLGIDSTAFARHWNGGWKGKDDLRGRVVISFHVRQRATVDEIFNDMAGAGYRCLQEPYDALWGVRYAIIEDPDGIAVGLMSAISADKKSPPPDL